jgi:hypothetical protein
MLHACNVAVSVSNMNHSLGKARIDIISSQIFFSYLMVGAVLIASDLI